MKKLKLLKWSIILGVLLGVFLKVRDFIIMKWFACGFPKIEICSLTAFLKELLIWVGICVVSTTIILFGISFLFKKVKNSKEIMKKFTLKKANKKAKEKQKEDKKKEKPKKEEKEEEIIKI